MNIWRGLYRVWLVLAVIWIVYVVVGSVFDFFAMNMLQIWARIFLLPSIAIAPPFIVLLIAIGIAWIVNGFAEAIPIPAIPQPLNSEIGIIVGIGAGLFAILGISILQLSN